MVQGRWIVATTLILGGTVLMGLGLLPGSQEKVPPPPPYSAAALLADVPAALSGPIPTPSPSPTPVPTPDPTPAPPQRLSSYVQPGSESAYTLAYDALCNQGFDWDCDTALRVASCETGGDYNQYDYNPSGATGLMQMMLPLHEGLFDGNPYDPYVNARAAYRLWASSGWTPWACY
jgi:hypothetical protein